MKMDPQARKLWQTISEDQVAPMKARALDIYNYKNELATLMILHVVSDEVFLMILNATFVKEAWD